MKIAYFGLPLGALLLSTEGHALPLVVLAPVDAPGRRRLRRVAKASRIIDAAESPPEEIDARVSEAFGRAAPDLVVSWYYTRKIPEALVSAAPQGGFGVHPSLLPRHRGPNPFYAAIDSGDEHTGVTAHRLDAEYDTGAILAQRAIAVSNRDAWQLARALDRPSLALLREVVRDAARGGLPPGTAQDEARATWAPEPRGDLLRVRWSWPTERILRRIRALSPVPGLAIDIRGLRLFVTRAARARRHPEVLLPGEAALHDDPERVVVRTGDGAVELLRAVIEEGEETTEVDASGLALLLRQSSGLGGASAPEV